MLSLLHETFGIGILEYMEKAIINDFILYPFHRIGMPATISVTVAACCPMP